jgi:hypothetical protein
MSGNPSSASSAGPTWIYRGIWPNMEKLSQLAAGIGPVRDGSCDPSLPQPISKQAHYDSSPPEIRPPYRRAGRLVMSGEAHLQPGSMDGSTHPPLLAEPIPQ